MSQNTVSQSKKWTAVALCAAVLLLSGCKTEVYQGLSEDQANAMMSVLLKNGIVPEKTITKEGYTLAVENNRVAQTLDLMRNNNLPREDYQNMGEIFSAEGMISSATEEHARMTYALSQELSETFSKIDGVLTSRVHVVMEQRDIASGKTTPASAAIFLRHLPDSVAPTLIPRMKQLTANAVPGLSQNNVSVMLVPVRDTITSPILDADLPGSSFFGAGFWGLFGVLLALAAGGGFWWFKGRRPANPAQAPAAEPKAKE